MLHLLKKYAVEKGLVLEPGFKAKDVRWAIVLDETGSFIEVLELGDPGDKKNRGQMFAQCPDLSQPEMIAGGVIRSQFLVETAEVVALYAKEKNQSGQAGKNEKILEKHQYFKNLLQEASQVDPRLLVAFQCISNDAELGKIQERLRRHKAKETDKVTFRIAGNFLVEDHSWHHWWRKYRSALAPSGPRTDRNMLCMMTGDLVLPAKTHPKIAGLAGVGGMPSGDVLIGFDKDAFSSYGLQQSQNASLSEACAAIYRSALENLIKETGHKIGPAIVIHWFDKKVQREDDPFGFLTLPGETEELLAQHHCSEMLKSIKTGNRPDLRNNHYFSMTLSGASGRIMLRDWMEGSFEKLITNIATWFKDLEIVRRDGEMPAPDPKFLAVLGATVRDLQDLQGPFISKMWRCAVNGELVPRSAVAQALFRFKTDMVQRQKEPFNHARMGLIRAYLVRKARFQGESDMANELKPSLNESHPHPAYHAGRLLAVMAALQKRALGDVGAGIVQRYYAAASATPALVLGRLVRTSQFHLSKLDSPGLAVWYENMLAEIWSRIQDSIPRTLNLEEQSLFALGYYQQIANMRMKRMDNKDGLEGETHEPSDI